MNSGTDAQPAQNWQAARISCGVIKLIRSVESDSPKWRVRGADCLELPLISEGAESNSLPCERLPGSVWNMQTSGTMKVLRRVWSLIDKEDVKGIANSKIHGEIAELTVHLKHALF